MQCLTETRTAFKSAFFIIIISLQESQLSELTQKILGQRSQMKAGVFFVGIL